MKSPYLRLFRHQVRILDGSDDPNLAYEFLKTCSTLLTQPLEQGVVELEWARLLFIRGQWDRCLEALDRVEAREGLLCAEDRSLFFLTSARLHQGYGDLNQSLTFLEQAVLSAEECGGEELIEALIDLGALFHRLGERDRGDEFLDRARELMLCGGTSSLQANLLIQQGLLAFRADNLIEAAKCYRSAYNLLPSPEQPSLLRGEIWRYLGVLSAVDGHLQEALKFQQDALADFLVVSYPLGCAKAYNSLGQTCLKLGSYQEARLFFEQAEGLCRQLGAEAERATILGKLGRVYAELGQYEKAILFQRQDLELSSRFGNYRALAYALRNLGLSYRAKGDFSQAVSYLEDSRGRFKELEDTIPQVYTVLDLVACLVDLKRWDDAGHDLDEALGLLEKRLESTPDHVRAHYFAALIARQRGQIQHAESALWRALEFADSFAIPELRTTIHFELGDLYRVQGDREGAVEQWVSAYRLVTKHPQHRLAFAIIEGLYQIAPQRLFEVLLVEEK